MSIFVCMLFIVSCMPKEYPFSFSPQKVSSFQESIPYIGCVVDMDHIIAKRLYSCRYVEKYIENGNVAEIAQMNSQYEQENVINYIQSKRDYQDIFLLQILSLKDTTSDMLNTFIYFSAKFTNLPINEAPYVKTSCTGFGPAYMGNFYSNKTKKLQLIKFEQTLSVKEKKEKFHFAESNDKTKLWMILGYQEADTIPQYIDVEKIVVRSKNKIGGARDLVIPVDSVMHDSLALRFKFLGSY